MDKRTVLAIVLALGTFFAWDAWMNAKYPDRYADLARDTAMAEGTDTQAGPDGVAATDAPEGTQGPVEQPATGQPAPTPTAGVAPEPAPPARPTVPVETVPFEGCGVDGEWTTEGGWFRSAILTDHQAPFDMQPLYEWLWDTVRGEGGPWQPYGGEDPGPEQLLTRDARVLGMGSGELLSGSAPAEIVSRSSDSIVLKGITDNEIEVVRSVRRIPDSDPCQFEVSTTWTNRGADAYGGTLWLQLHDALPEESPGRWGNAVQPYVMVDEDYEWMDLEDLEDVQHFEGPVDWMALSDRYFALVLLPQEGPGDGELYFSRIEREGADDELGLHYAVKKDLAPGEAYSEGFTMYVGPKNHAVLKGLHPELTKLVNLGWFAFFGKILLALLRFFHGLVGQWGLAIILLTLSVKLLFFPLTQTSFKSSQAMSALQPELQEIREKYKDSPEELNRRTMELFRERGVNPLGGCLPMLVQFPVWIALYQVLLNSVELYHTEFLYLRDLSSVDPYGILPAVVVVLMLIQQQFMPMGNMDPSQARLMRLMPLLFGFFFFAFPAGLVVYIFVNMCLTIVQQWIIRRTYKGGRDEEAVAAATS